MSCFPRFPTGGALQVPAGKRIRKGGLGWGGLHNRVYATAPNQGKKRADTGATPPKTGYLQAVFSPSSSPLFQCTEILRIGTAMGLADPDRLQDSAETSQRTIPHTSARNLATAHEPAAHREAFPGNSRNEPRKISRSHSSRFAIGWGTVAAFHHSLKCTVLASIRSRAAPVANFLFFRKSS